MEAFTVSFPCPALVLLVSAQPVLPPFLFTLYNLHLQYLCDHFAAVLTEVTNSLCSIFTVLGGNSTKLSPCRRSRTAATCVRNTSGIPCPSHVATSSAPSAWKLTGTMLTTRVHTSAHSAGSPTTRGPPRDAWEAPGSPPSNAILTPFHLRPRPLTTTMLDPRM